MTLTGRPVGTTIQAGTSLDCQRRRSRRAVFALAVLSLAAFAYVTTESLPIGLLLPMSKGLRAQEPAIGLLVTAYGAVVVVASVPLTLLTQRLPRRLVLCCVLAAFVVASLSSAAAPSYEALLGARLVTALSQALFWALVIPTAAGLASPAAGACRGRRIRGGLNRQRRGRARGDLAWPGRGLASSVHRHRSSWDARAVGRRDSAPDRGFGRQHHATCRVPGPAPLPTGSSRNGPVYHRFFHGLYVPGALPSRGRSLGRGGNGAGAAGARRSRCLRRVRCGVRRRTVPRASLIIPVACQAVALIGLFALGQSSVFAVGLVAITGFAFAAFTATLGSRVMEVAPGSVDLASATISTAVNLGISAGALGGGLLLSNAGARSTVLVAGVLSAAALALALRERPRPPRAQSR